MLMIGVSGLQLSAQEQQFLQHPGVAGIILFSRNFASKNQLQDLCSEIRTNAAYTPLIAVDQEGGRVQRFKAGFTPLPSLQNVGALIRQDQILAWQCATAHAYVMAREIMASGLDLSFAPIADLARGNLAIGDRAFCAEPEYVAEYIRAYITGLHCAGMAATLKHFPGHGSVLEDTHFDEARDLRSFEEIASQDLVPFCAGIDAGAEAVMMAHVCYPAVAAEPAGYSPYWMRTVLQTQLGFKGVIISDDIGMAASESAGGVVARVQAHLSAGCDLVLACPPAIVEAAVHSLPVSPYKRDRLDVLRAKQTATWSELDRDNDYLHARHLLSSLELSHAP